MTRQEEIKEGMAKDLAVIDVRGRTEYKYYTREDIWQAVLDEGTEGLYLEDARLIMVGLHSEGVVIKVAEIQEVITTADKPETYYAQGSNRAMLSTERTFHIYKAFKEMDYVATEPLIKGELCQVDRKR